MKTLHGSSLPHNMAGSCRISYVMFTEVPHSLMVKVRGSEICKQSMIRNKRNNIMHI